MREQAPAALRAVLAETAGQAAAPLGEGPDSRLRDTGQTEAGEGAGAGGSAQWHLGGHGGGLSQKRTCSGHTVQPPRFSLPREGAESCPQERPHSKAHSHSVQSGQNEESQPWCALRE